MLIYDQKIWNIQNYVVYLHRDYKWDGLEHGLFDR